MAYSLFKSVSGFQQGSTHVQYQITQKGSTVITSWTTVGITEIAVSTDISTFGVTASFNDGFEGMIMWRESTAALKVATEEINPQFAERIDVDVSSRMSSTRSTLGSTQAVASVTGSVGSVAGNVDGSVGSIASTAALPSNLVEVKNSTANVDNWVTDIDATISSRMSSTRSTLGTTVGAQLSSTAVDLIWDEVLSKATHNVPQSAAKRLQNITDPIIRADTAQGDGSGSNQIQFDVGASTVDGAYDPASVHIHSGAGAGQTRGILEYDGATRIATVNRNWKQQPSSDSEFVIQQWVGHDHVNEGLAQGGTANTITLNTLASTVNNIYIGQLVFIVSGVGDDQVGLVTDYVGATKVATVETHSTDGNWPITPTTQSAYVMLPDHVHLSTEFTGAVIDVLGTTISSTAALGSMFSDVRQSRQGMRNALKVTSTDLTTYTDGSTTSIAWRQSLSDDNTTVLRGLPTS